MGPNGSSDALPGLPILTRSDGVGRLVEVPTGTPQAVSLIPTCPHITYVARETEHRQRPPSDGQPWGIKTNAKCATLAGQATRARCATRTKFARCPRGPSVPCEPGATDAPCTSRAPSVPRAQVRVTVHIGQHVDTPTSVSKSNVKLQRSGHHCVLRVPAITVHVV